MSDSCHLPATAVEYPAFFSKEAKVARSWSLGNEPHLGLRNTAGYFPVIKQTRDGWQTGML